MRARFFYAAAALGLATASVVFAGDWPGWRGPQRNGIAPPSAPLLDAFPADGPKKLWTSEPIKGGESAGFGSPVVALGRVYLYQNHNMPPEHRILYKAVYQNLGYAPDMPAELAKAVEEARTSEERRKLDPRALDPWINDWLETHVTAEQRPWRGAAQARLKAGPNALPLDVIARLAPIVDKRFEPMPELDAWAKANGVDEESLVKLRQLTVPGDEKTPRDSIWCLDAASGRTLWKTPISANWFYYACSSTPTVAGARLYVTNSEARVFCLDAVGGAVLWISDPLGPMSYHHNRSSSPLLIDGTVIVFSETCLAGIEAATGKVLWKNPHLPNQQSSAACWTSGAGKFAIVNAGNKLSCVDPKDGSVIWDVPCAAVSTPAIVGDIAAVGAGNDKGQPGLSAYKLSAQKAELLWKVPWKDGHSGAIIHEGCVYALGGAFYDRNQGKAICVDLATGAVKWEQVVGQAMHSSPLLADGKIIALNGGALLMLKATSEKYTPLGSANVGADAYTSPAIADGKVFLRTDAGIVCYSLMR